MDKYFVWMWLDRDTDQGFLLCDKAIRGVRPDIRLWEERFLSDSRIARVLRTMLHGPDYFFLHDGHKPLTREAAEKLFLAAMLKLGSDGGRVIISQRAMHTLLELPGSKVTYGSPVAVESNDG